MKLTIDHFADFFTEIHEYAPFPWQTALAHRVWKDQRWVDAIQVDTGLGKTSYLDVAVFMLALQAYMDPSERPFPVRIIHVVNRRVVVDEVEKHGDAICEVLKDALENDKQGSICFEVAKRLCHYTGLPDVKDPTKSRFSIKPLVVAKLRGGGIPKDDLWYCRPDQPLILSTTLDQFGSRYFFRGYLSSSKQAAIQTALVANDALVVLDEAHLAQPLLESIRQMDERYRVSVSPEIPDRRHILRMSATLTPRETDTVHRIDPLNLGAMEKRYTVSKIAELLSAGQKLVEKATDQVGKYFKAGHKVIAVVVNQVATARDVADACKAQGYDTHLVTGRMRPLDRKALDPVFEDRLKPGRTRENDTPLVIVSTQCIEVGADFDFDAMITECASLDALRQRIGRVDRLGDYGKAQVTIFQTSDEVVYEDSKKATWTWLLAHAKKKKFVDFGHAAFKAFEGALEGNTDLYMTPNRAPILSVVDVDLLVQTCPRPYPDIGVEPFIHGLEANTPEIFLLWRDDLEITSFEKLSDTEEDRLSRLFQIRVPSPGEMIAVPIYALSGLYKYIEKKDSQDPVADIQGVSVKGLRGTSTRKVLRFTRDTSSKKQHEVDLVSIREVRPGDIIILPSNDGGIRNGTWNPIDRRPVSDLGDSALFEHTGIPVISLHPKVLGFDVGDVGSKEIVLATLENRRDMLSEAHREILDGLKRLRMKDIMLEVLKDDGDAHYAVLHSQNKRAPYLDGDDDNLSYQGREVLLDDHLRHVETWARYFGKSVGMPDILVDALAFAGKWHDLGKADPRFQYALYDGDLTKVGGPLLAKSRKGKTSNQVKKYLRDVLHYPKGWRHEILSLAMLPETLEVEEVELVKHLIGSHHGWCRPYAPPVEDAVPAHVQGTVNKVHFDRSSEHTLARLDSEIPLRFEELNGTYGIYTVAWLEMILRMADITASILEAEGNLE